MMKVKLDTKGIENKPGPYRLVISGPVGCENDGTPENGGKAEHWYAARREGGGAILPTFEDVLKAGLDPDAVIVDFTRANHVMVAMALVCLPRPDATMGPDEEKHAIPGACSNRDIVGIGIWSRLMGGVPGVRIGHPDGKGGVRWDAPTEVTQEAESYPGVNMRIGLA